MTIKPNTMPRAKTYSQTNFKALRKQLKAYNKHLVTQQRFIQNYGEIYQMPKKMCQGNILAITKIRSAIITILSVDHRRKGLH